MLHIAAALLSSTRWCSSVELRRRDTPSTLACAALSEVGLLGLLSLERLLPFEMRELQGGGGMTDSDRIVIHSPPSCHEASRYTRLCLFVERIRRFLLYLLPERINVPVRCALARTVSSKLLVFLGLKELLHGICRN